MLTGTPRSSASPRTPFFASRTAPAGLGRFLLTMGAAVFVASCGSGVGPTPTPADVSSILGNLARQGATVTSTVSGDPGCNSPGLQGNAIHLQVRLDTGPRDVYLFIFRNPRAFDAGGAPVDACQQELQRAHPGQRVERVDVQPFRALGPAWSDALRSAVSTALTDAAAGG